MGLINNTTKVLKVNYYIITQLHNIRLEFSNSFRRSFTFLNIGLYLIIMSGLFAMRQSMLVQCFCVRSVYFRPGGVAGAG